MDWVNQNKFRNWLNVVLLAFNLLAVSIIWMQTAKHDEPKEGKPRASESVQLMRKAIDLTEEQTRQLEQMRKEQLEQSKEYNDRMTVLKRQLAEELFSNKPDTALANLKAKEIGELQSHVELIRFRHFNDLLAICTPEQKEKLRPIVLELFGRRPPKDDGEKERSREPKQTNGPPREDKKELEKDKPHDQRPGAPNRRDETEERTDDRPPPPDERRGPPSVDEKLAKYTERLNLSEEQIQKVRSELEASRQKGEELRRRPNPNRDEIEAEKENIGKDEDARVRKILTDEQKREFEKMISKRRK